MVQPAVSNFIVTKFVYLIAVVLFSCKNSHQLQQLQTFAHTLVTANNTPNQYNTAAVKAEHNY